MPPATAASAAKTSRPGAPPYVRMPALLVADAPAVPLAMLVSTVPILVYGARVFDERTSPLFESRKVSEAGLVRSGHGATHGFPELKMTDDVAATGELVSATVAVVGKAPTKPVAVSETELARIELYGAAAVEMAFRREDGADSPWYESAGGQQCVSAVAWDGIWGTAPATTGETHR